MRLMCKVTIASSETGAKLSAPIRCEADSGADITCLPAELLKAMGYKPTHTQRFTDAGGQVVARQVGYAWVEVVGRLCFTEVQFNEGPDANLLSNVTMAQLRLAPDTGEHPRWIDTTGPTLKYINATTGEASDA